MSLVSYDYLYQQTVAGPGYNNHWIDLIIDVLALTRRGKPVLVDGHWSYPSDMVQKVLKMSPSDLQKILDGSQEK